MLLGLLLVAGLVLILDQSTKMLVTRRLAEGQSVPVASWLKVRRVTNRRGVLLPHTGMLLLILAALSGGICLMVRQGYFFQSRTAQLGLGMALGGAYSNGYDQLRRGAIVDFLDLGWWPVFNLADMAITVGAILAVWFMR